MTPDFFIGLKNPVTFYIIRHGQSEGNAEKIMQGRGEYALTELGRSQSAMRGLSLKHLVLQNAQKNAWQGNILYFSSPMKRAKETTLIIGKESGLGQPQFLEDLMEMELGVWTGKTWDEVKSEKELWQDFRRRSWDAIPQAESSGDLYSRSLRIWAALRDAAMEKEAGTVVVVTHGGLIQWLLKSTMGSKDWLPLLPISNCGLFKLSVEPLPEQNGAFFCWDEINSPLAAKTENARGFPT